MTPSATASPCIDRVRLLGARDDASVLDELAREFPTLPVERAASEQGSDLVVDGAAWDGAPDFRGSDEAFERAPSRRILAVRGPDAARTAREIVTRYQRFVGRRNAASATPLFDDVLQAHRALHDLSLPLVKADHDHALDAWQWMLRLAPDAELAVQLAALFHDVERLESEPRQRIEQHAADYQAFKDAHARRGAEITFAVLVEAGVDEATARRASELVGRHERRADDPAIALLNDADGLSFFSLNSPGYMDYFGPEQTRRKVAYTLGRLGAGARAKLAGVRLRPDVARVVQEIARA